MKIKPHTLEIESEIWYAWKKRIPRDKTLSQAIEDLIKRDLASR